jgi:SAM-dependent methyltransferase
MSDSHEHWGGGPAYERYMGRWSRLAARTFLRWLEAPTGLSWLDVGCGTGALAFAIAAEARPGAVLGIDPTPDFVAHARSQSSDSRLRFEVGSAEALPVDSGAHDVIVSGLALNFMPDLRAAMAEMARVTRTGGTVAAYVWDYAGRMAWLRHFWDAARALDPGAARQDEGRRFPICQPGPLGDLFSRGGLAHVRVEALDIETRFVDFDDYWTPFLSGQFPGPQYLATLEEAQRAALRELLRARLPVQPDGTIRLAARIWAARGAVP